MLFLPQKKFACGAKLSPFALQNAILKGRYEQFSAAGENFWR